MKKKLLSLVMCVLTVLSIVPMMSVSAETKTYTSGKYKYIILADKTVEITDYTGNASNVTIPSKLNNKKVTSIGFNAFYYKTSLESVTIPSSVTNIDRYAFEDCYYLKNVTMSNSVKNIEKGAFYYCSGLENITLSSNLTTINPYTFYHCETLTAITIPESVKIIDQYAFNRCTSLRNVKIPESVEYIGEYAFYYCSKLAVLFLPSNLKHIGECAFGNTAFYNDKSNWENGALYRGEYLLSANVTNENADFSIKEGTTFIASKAFSDRDKLVSITFPESLSTIPYGVCYDCDSLTTINVPNSVIYISSGAFENCEKLNNINLGNNVERIGEFAFYNTGYYNLNTNWENGVLYIDGYLISMKPSFVGDYTVKDGTIGIANSACSDCDARYYDDYDDEWYSNKYDETDFNYSTAKWYGCVGLTAVKLPASVKYIGSHAFDGCDSITTLELNEGLNVIGAKAFDGCKALDVIKIPQSVKTFGAAALDANTVKVIEGYKDSVAQTYAQENKIQFVNAVCENGGEHTPVELNAKKASYFEKGYTAHSKCSVCGEDLSFVVYSKKTTLKKSVFSLKGAKKAFKITCKKINGAKGFEIKYKTGKGKWKTKSYNATKKVTKTIKSLKKGKKYSVKIRAFAKIDGKKLYSNWTGVKSVKAK